MDDFRNFLLKKDSLSRGGAAFYTRIPRSVLKRAVANEMILKNPTDVVQKISTPEPEMAFLNIDEAKTLAECLLMIPTAWVRVALFFLVVAPVSASPILRFSLGQNRDKPHATKQEIITK
jgi:hypothetical protein